MLSPAATTQFANLYRLIFARFFIHTSTLINCAQLRKSLVYNICDMLLIIRDLFLLTPLECRLTITFVNAITDSFNEGVMHENYSWRSPRRTLWLAHHILSLLNATSMTMTSIAPIQIARTVRICERQRSNGRERRKRNDVLSPCDRYTKLRRRTTDVGY
jgi:hypothetical protein